MASGRGADLAGHAGGGSADRRRAACCGIRLCDQGVDKDGNPEAGFMPGMDIRAALTVVGDGPVGAVGRQLDKEFGLPGRPSSARMGPRHEDGGGPARGTRARSPARSSTPSAIPSPRSSASSTCIPERVATVGIFVPSWFRSSDADLLPLPAALHAASVFLALSEGRQAALVGREIAAGIGQGAASRSWRATATRASAKAPAAPTCSPAAGVDEAWTTGTQLGEAVLELLQRGQAAHQGESGATYVARRRASWVEEEGRIAEKARDGFHRGMIPGLLGMAIAGFTDGKHSIGGEPQADARVRRNITATRSPPPNSQRSWKTAARAASAATMR